ncbi:TPA: hypothetical protein DCZ90_04350 [Candidatus Amesbacteria bacterium]|nr:hypothetical protein [Candidatus Amesbacteria bacterium]
MKNIFLYLLPFLCIIMHLVMMRGHGSGHDHEDKMRKKN